MEAGWSARRVARQVGRSDLTVRRCWDQWAKETSFTTTLRAPSSDHSLRRSSYHTTRPRRANCLIGHCPNTGSTFTTDPCVFLNHHWLKDIWYRCAH
ncbi:uncharacterized protein TNCV_1587261 [Trichonephila clavipes]|nr:uncharacterized protein TNCV_1587261 [Trichonephila clavipes]